MGSNYSILPIILAFCGILPTTKGSKRILRKMKENLHTTSAIKIGRDDRYASSVVSTKFGIGRKVEGVKALFS